MNIFSIYISVKTKTFSFLYKPHVNHIIVSRRIVAPEIMTIRYNSVAIICARISVEVSYTLQ